MPSPPTLRSSPQTRFSTAPDWPSPLTIFCATPCQQVVSARRECVALDVIANFQHKRPHSSDQVQTLHSLCGSTCLLKSYRSADCSPVTIAIRSNPLSTA